MSCSMLPSPAIVIGSLKPELPIQMRAKSGDRWVRGGSSIAAFDDCPTLHYDRHVLRAKRIDVLVREAIDD